MKGKKNPYEGNKRIIEDEVTYEDHNTVLLINLIAGLVITATLIEAEVVGNPTMPKEINQSNPSYGIRIVSASRNAVYACTDHNSFDGIGIPLGQH
jgi:hypothetical protein